MAWRGKGVRILGLELESAAICLSGGMHTNLFAKVANGEVILVCDDADLVH